jgi:hypothetical protein
MKYKNKKTKVERFIKDQLTNTKTMNLLLLEIDTDSYALFGKYTINKENNYYVVCTDGEDKKRIFNTLKTAVTWCVFKEKNRTLECKQIEQIDFKLSSLEVDILQTTKILNNLKDENFKLVFISKIEESNIKKKLLLIQLNKLINTSKDWQTKKFSEAKSTSKR